MKIKNNNFLLIFVATLIVLSSGLLFNKFISIYFFKSGISTPLNIIIFLFFWFCYSFIIKYINELNFYKALFEGSLGFLSFFIVIIPFLIKLLNFNIDLFRYFSVLSISLFIAIKTYFLIKKYNLDAKDISKKTAWMVLIFVSILYFIIFSIYPIYDVKTLNSGCMDLGAMEQAVYNTLRGKILYNTIYENASSRLGNRLELPLLYISPLYAIFKSPYVFPIFQSLIVSFGGIALFLLTKEVLKKNLYGLVFAFVYFLHPAMQNAVLFDFHSITLSPTFIFFALYFLIKRRFFFYFLFAFLAVTTREEVFFIFIFLGIYLLFSKRIKVSKIIAISTFIIPLIAFIFLTTIFFPYFKTIDYDQQNLNQNFEEYKELQNEVIHSEYNPVSWPYKDFGDNFFEIIKNIALHPVVVIKKMFFEENNINYLFLLLIPLGFLSLFSPTALLISLPIYALHSLSSWPAMKAGAFHYSAPLIATSIFAAIFGFKNIMQCFKDKIKNIGTIVIIFIFACSLIYYIFYGFIPKKITPPSEHQEAINEVKKYIPSNASLSVSTMLCPHFTREKLYQFPVINNANYILLDREECRWSNLEDNCDTYLLAVEKISEYDEDNYELIYNKKGFRLLKKTRNDLKNYKVFPATAKEIINKIK